MTDFLEFNRVCRKILLYHKSDLEYDSVVEFSEVKSCELFDLFKSVNKCISVNEQLSRCFGNVQIVLEEALDSEQCFMVERFDRAFLENLLKEGLAECCREVVDHYRRKR